MASSLPIPKPPDTPTPPSDDDAPHGLGLDGVDSYNPNTLSPYTENFNTQTTMAAAMPADQQLSRGTLSPVSINGASSPEHKGPFNFKSQPMDLTKLPVTRSSVGQRRGHKYKHSSISANIFLEPEARAPLTIPASLPMPTIRECWHSMDRSQTVRVLWSVTHATIAGIVLYAAEGSLAQTALSHLLLYDSFGAMLVVVVDVLSNFDVWKRSSVRHPFGLQRAEVLTGFAMSVLLVFMGFDLISHTAKHMLEAIGDHEPHVEHEHERLTAGEVDSAAVCAIAATLISAVVLKNHGRIGKVLRFAYFQNLPGILSNPSHLLTLVCSGLLVLLPFLSIELYNWLDRTISGIIGVSMCALGLHLVWVLGMMLLMSYNGGGVAEVLSAIESDQCVAKVEEARFWQVHYNLNMANVIVRVVGSDDNLTRLRERITSLVRNRLGGGYGSGNGRWEVNVQMIADNM